MPERLDDLLAHPPQLVVARRVDPVGGDDLGRDPARAHRLEDVRVVVRDELVHDVAADRDRVVEALVALDELLDGDRGAAVEPLVDDGALELAVVVDPLRAGGAGAGARLEDDRVADLGGEHRAAPAGSRRRATGRTETPASRSASFIAGLSRQRKAVCTVVPGIPAASRTFAAGQDVGLDGRLQAIHPGSSPGPAAPPRASRARARPSAPARSRPSSCATPRRSPPRGARRCR